MRTGRQEPTFEVIGDYVSSLGAEVVEMFEEDGGATFYPSQKREMELLLARNGDGSPSALTIGISKPRQNGKSYAGRFYAIYMAVFEHRQVLYSAHHSSTTNKMFKAMCDLFESPERYPEFARDKKQITKGRGYEGIYFKEWTDDDGNVQPGGCIEFATRTNSGARGGTYSVIVIDEAQELTYEQQEAMLPVMSAASDIKDRSKLPQQIFIGTPPNSTCHGTVFKKMHAAAHSLEPGDAWWMEWSVEADSLDKIATSMDEAIERAYETNPAMGYRIAEETIANEYETMTLDGFARERLGWWAPDIAEQSDKALDQKSWEACRSSEPKPEPVKTAYGVKFSADGSMVCLCGAVIDGNDHSRIALIDQQPTGRGIQWLADWLNERVKVGCCVVIDGRNGVDLLIDRIRDTWKYKDSIIKPSANTMVAAASLLIAEIGEQTLTWYIGQEALNQSAVSSVKRPISGGWGFGGDDSIAIEGCSLALWGVRNSRRNPSKTMRIG